jgi:flagellar protein FliS
MSNGYPANAAKLATTNAASRSNAPLNSTTSNTQSKTVNTYLKSKVMSATPQELRLMLLDGALRFARQGREGLTNKNFEASFNGFSQCREIIIELMTGIRPDTDPDLANKVKSLYSFMYKHLVEGVHEKDFKKIDEVITLLEYERETWTMAMDKAAQELAGTISPPPASSGDGPLSRPIAA